MELIYISIAILFYTYFGYPLVLLFLVKIKRKNKKTPVMQKSLSTISVVIPAFNEEDCIIQKIKNTLDLSGYRNFIVFQMRMLKGLKIHKLIIKDINLGQWELIHLAKVPLEEIDLRLNKPVQLDILPKIKTLKKITLYKNQYPEHILKKIPDHILVTQVDKE